MPLFDERPIPDLIKQQQSNEEVKKEQKKEPITVNEKLLSETPSASFVITNIGRNLLSESKEDSVLVVKDGEIVCSGQCAQALTNDITEINVHGGYVVPVSFFMHIKKKEKTALFIYHYDYYYFSNV